MQVGTSPDRGRVVIFWIDGTTLADWSRPGLRSFQRVLREGAVATLSTWTGSTAASMPAMRAGAAATFAATPPGPGEQPVLSARRDEQGHAGLGLLLASSRRTWTILGAAERDPTHGAVLEAMGGESPGPAGRDTTTPSPIRTDRAFPTGARTDTGAVTMLARARLAGTDLVIVDFGDTARVESQLGTNPGAREPWIDLSLRRADRLLGELLRMLRPQDTVALLSPTPPVLRQSEDIRFGALAILGPGYRRALLSSATTHRPGFVPLTDMAPTVLALLRLPSEEAFLSGRAIRAARARDDAPAAARALERDLIAAARAHTPTTRALLAWATLWSILALLTVLAGRGLLPHARRLPGGRRDWLSVLLTQATLAPVIINVLAVFGPNDPTGSVLLAFVMSLATALAARAALGRERSMIAALIAAFVVPLLDVLMGSPLGARSPLVSPLAEGRNLDGVDAAVVGVVFAGAIFGSAMILDRIRPARWSLATPAATLAITPAVTPIVALAAASLVLGATSSPRLLIAATPAAVLLAARATGRLVSVRSLLALACGIVFILGVLSLDYEPEGGDPISVIITGDLSPVARDHAEAARRLFGLTVWPFALAALVAPAALLTYRRRTLMERAFWGRSTHRAAPAAAAATAAASLLAIESGLVTAAYLALYASTTTLLPLLAPDDSR